jgi:RNA polymerase sigma-70 factor (ECF subfamily)
MTRSHELKLIRRTASGDRDAAGELIRGHQSSLYSYILRISGRSDVAEDVVQEAFVRVLANLDRFDSRFRFSTWLFTIARRVYFNMCEKKKPAPESEKIAEWTGCSQSPDRGAEQEDTQEHFKTSIQSALMALPIDQREVVVLFHQHDWPIWLIAEHLQIPEGTVKSHLHRGRLRLRDALQSAPARSVETLKELLQ